LSLWRTRRRPACHQDKRSETTLSRKSHANETERETVLLVSELAATVSLDSVIGAAAVEAQVEVQEE
jgi:hypothetical protein